MIVCVTCMSAPVAIHLGVGGAHSICSIVVVSPMYELVCSDGLLAENNNMCLLSNYGIYMVPIRCFSQFPIAEMNVKST